MDFNFVPPFAMDLLGATFLVPGDCTEASKGPCFLPGTMRLRTPFDGGGGSSPQDVRTAPRSCTHPSEVMIGRTRSKKGAERHHRVALAGRDGMAGATVGSRRSFRPTKTSFPLCSSTRSRKRTPCSGTPCSGSWREASSHSATTRPPTSRARSLSRPRT